MHQMDHKHFHRINNLLKYLHTKLIAFRPKVTNSYILNL